MRKVNNAGAAVLELLRDAALLPTTEGDASFPYAKVDNSNGTYMPVSVERLRDHKNGCEVWAVAHYYGMNGDLCADPSVEFLRVREGEWYPLSFQQDPMPGYCSYVILDEDTMMPHSGNVYRQSDCAVFCGKWMRNIREQQGLKPITLNARRKRNVK